MDEREVITATDEEIELQLHELFAEIKQANEAVIEDKSKHRADLAEYIRRNFVSEPVYASPVMVCASVAPGAPPQAAAKKETRKANVFGSLFKREAKCASVPLDDLDEEESKPFEGGGERSFKRTVCASEVTCFDEAMDYDIEELESKLQERMEHRSDTFSEYLMYLIQNKEMENSDVWKRAIVDKKVFSKIKNNVDYHPQKLTALCLCVGAKLNLDESKDLLARAGYALSPCDKTDIIFSYFLENEIYDMYELDIQLEEYGLPHIID